MKKIAHRGYHRYTKENCLLSFLLAMNHDNFDGIELDIHFGKDDIYIYHDDYIIKDKNAIEIKNMDRKLSVKYGIECLSHILKSCKKYNKIIIIDIKGNESDTIEIERNIIELLELCQNYNNIYICSFNNFYIDILRLKQLKNIKIGYITSNSNIEIKDGIQFISIDKDMLNNNIIEKCVKENIEIITWTIQNEYEYNIIKNYNIDMIIADIDLVYNLSPSTIRLSSTRG